MSEQRRRPRERADWERCYVDGTLPWDSDTPDEHLRRVREDHRVAPGRALEIGCGTGTNSIWLAEQGFEMTGIDISPTAIATAGEKAAAAGVECRFLAGDFLADEVPGAPFDFALDRGCLHVFESPEERARFASRVHDLLAPEGLWFSLSGSTDGPPRDTGPPRLSAADIAAAVEPRFEILELRSTVFDRERHREIRAWVLVARRRAPSPA